MRVLIWILILPVLLLACILVAYRVPLPASLSGSRDQVAAAVAGLAGLGYLLVLAAYLVGSLWRSARALDPVLAPLGLAPSGYGGFGRRYSGVLEGRVVEVLYLPAQATRPARLDLTVEAETGVRMAAGRQRPLLDCRDCPRLDLGADLGYAVYAQDESAARRLLADPAARAALDRLMEEPAGQGDGRSLYVQPERLWLRVRPWRVTGAEVEGWLRELARLGAVVV